MRKLVIFLFFSALFLLYPCVSNSPIVERITTGEVLKSVKNFFALEQPTGQDDTRNEAPSLPADNQKSSKNKLTDLDVESQTANIYGERENENREAPSEEISVGNGENRTTDRQKDFDASAEEGSFNATLEPVLEAPKKLLDLTLPELVDDVLDMKIFKYEYKSMLPNLFTPSVVKEEDERTSFGGRILMEEGFEEREEYRLQDIGGSIEGAELTLEVKTN